ncbi:UNVERIFIED_CONTAM: hypothetical protein PYX00_007078 [Menopon gallinae]|uniref:asparaginase n=1 Tax=Menopon gallinae TaxID=328185 RepID=A0AAW2HHG0_9NEOP
MDTSENQEVRNVLVLYVGGTIGMIRNESGVLKPEADIFSKKLKNISQLHDQQCFQFDTNQSEKDILVLPLNEYKFRILYEIKEFDPLLDSSSMGSEQWKEIAFTITEVYSKYDGFVVVHGTDTLVYTASALSFLLGNLEKPIIITGSQLPIDNSRSDGISNLYYSLVFAGAFNIPEVCVFFDKVLLRGNRTIKISSDTFDGFVSPNYDALATIGCEIKLNLPVYKQTSDKLWSLDADFNPNVVVLTLYPDISEKMIRSAFESPTEGVVLLTFGSGNMPSNKSYIIEAIKEATERGVLVVNCTQCLKGSVKSLYETNQVLMDVGAVSAFDMTMEATYTKLRYILAQKNLSLEERKKMMERSIRGELTSQSSCFCLIPDRAY